MLLEKQQLTFSESGHFIDNSILWRILTMEKRDGNPRRKDFTDTTQRSFEQIKSVQKTGVERGKQKRVVEKECIECWGIF